MISDAVLMALAATTGTWLVTVLGAATVFCFKATSAKLLNSMLGFAAGVMIAASFWSLLAPAIALAEKTLATPSYLVVTLGFVCGALFLWLSDKVVTRAQDRARANGAKTQGEKQRRMMMLILSITLHNIPEGLAVGVAFGALHRSGYSTEELLAAVSVAVGIGLQNFPEGAAVALPLRRDGYSRRRSFFWGQASGMVEPLFGLLGAVLVIYIESLLPFALAFAAGAMILVAVHELIPECQKNKEVHPYFSTMGIIAGFSAMMMLDVMLG